MHVLWGPRQLTRRRVRHTVPVLGLEVRGIYIVSIQKLATWNWLPQSQTPPDHSLLLITYWGLHSTHWGTSIFLPATPRVEIGRCIKSIRKPASGCGQ